MAREWTKAQKDAIFAKDADILVSAAAGSGKTAVLVERIIQKIMNQEQAVDIDRLLVVTFTNAAAAEMRQRISDALAMQLENEPDNAWLNRQLTLLPSAQITTIHSFCHALLRSNFHLLDLDPNFRIADVTENEILRLNALEEVIDELYDDPVWADSFLKLTESYLNPKKPEDFYKLINRIYDFSMSLPDPKEWLEVSASRFNFPLETDFNYTVFAKSVVQVGKKKIQSIIEKYDVMLEHADQDDGGEVLLSFLNEEKNKFLALLKENSYQGIREKILDLSFDRIPSAPRKSEPRYRNMIMSLRDDVKKTVNIKLCGELFLYSSEEQKNILCQLAPVMACLSETVRRLIVRFDEKKDEKNLLNYNDLEHGCYRLLVDADGRKTALAERVKAVYDEILIDEYQDTSALQEAIFNAIKKENSMFLVGDIKQSIYRFRNTNPLLFQDKKNTYMDSPDALQRKILLSNNFRSRKSVLASINYIFSQIMSEEMGEICYNEEEMLYPGLQYPDSEHEGSPETELLLTDLGAIEDEEETLETIEAEAILAARKIESLLSSQYQVLGKEGMRQITYRDICILLRSTKEKAEVYSKILSEYGIPCYSEAGDSFLQSEEITVMLSLLKVIDNPHQDIPLLALLRSQLYAMQPDELTEIRLSDRSCDLYSALKLRSEQNDELGRRLQRFLEDLSCYREKSSYLSTSELVWYLYMQTGFYESQATLPGGGLRRLNLRLLYTRAENYEKTGLKGLYNFIHFLDEYQSIGGDYDAARTIGEEQNVVRIMSIHKSKGLEFPVVIIGGLARKFNLQDLHMPVLIHGELGYGPKYVNNDLGLVYDNAARFGVRESIYYESLSEEMRILYVAMTRAREKLILLSATKNLKNILKRCAIRSVKHPISASFASEATSYLDWIVMALLSHPQCKLLQDLSEMSLTTEPKAYGYFSVTLTQEEELFNCDLSTEDSIETVEEKEISTQILSLLDERYDFENETELPAKVTVTEVKRRFFEEEPDGVFLYPCPMFLKQVSHQLSSTEIGTAVHTVLEMIDFNRTASIEDINNQIQDLIEKKILSEKEGSFVSAEQILKLMESDVGTKLKLCKVEREVSFGIPIDAYKIYGKPGEIMLQGMIDCVIFEGETISILDYKTDRGCDEQEIAEKYKIQLECYKKAAEIIYDKTVSKCYLYLISQGKIIIV